MSVATHSVICTCLKSNCPGCLSRLQEFDYYLNSHIPVGERMRREPRFFDQSPGRALPVHLHHTILEKMDAARSTFSQQSSQISVDYATQVMMTLTNGFEWLARILRHSAQDAGRPRAGPVGPAAVVIIRDISRHVHNLTDFFFCGQGLRNICPAFADAASCSSARFMMSDAHAHFLEFLKSFQVACFIIQEPFIVSEALVLFVSSILVSNSNDEGYRQRAAEILCLVFRPHSRTGFTIGSAEIRLFKGTIQNYQSALAASLGNGKRVTAWGEILKALRQGALDAIVSLDFVTDIQLGMVLTMCPYGRIQRGLNGFEASIVPDWLQSYDSVLRTVYDSKSVREAEMKEIVQYILGFVDDKGRFLHEYFTLVSKTDAAKPARANPFVFINIISNYTATLFKREPASDERKSIATAIQVVYDQCAKQYASFRSNKYFSDAVHGLEHAIRT